MDDMLTTWVDGSRSLAGGVYTFSVGGHLPDDSKGTKLSSNVVTVSLSI